MQTIEDNSKLGPVHILSDIQHKLRKTQLNKLELPHHASRFKK